MIRAPIKEGEMTKTVYHHIMEQHYDEAVRILSNELQNFHRVVVLFRCLGIATTTSRTSTTHRRRILRLWKRVLMLMSTRFTRSRAS